MGKKGKWIHVLKSLQVVGVSVDRTKMVRGWGKMASILRDGKLLRKYNGIMAGKWQLKYLLNEHIFNKYWVDV